MRIDYAKRFRKNLKKSPVHIKHAFAKRLALFIENMEHPLLRNHKLHGNHHELWSIDVTGDWRALYHVVDGNIEWVEFVNIGTHSELYG